MALSRALPPISQVESHEHATWPSFLGRYDTQSLCLFINMCAIISLMAELKHAILMISLCILEQMM